MDASVELVKHVLPSVVHIHAEVPSAHPSARLLGDERMGTGTVVGRDGLILTVNYDVMGGKTIDVTYLGEFEAYWEYLLERGIVSSAANLGYGGGPLFTLLGQMVGVVSLNLSEVVRNSLAIPTECYEQNREELLRYGRVVSRPQRAWLGVFAHPLEEGVVVAGVVPNGPGARSGVQEGDVIVALDSREVATRKDLYLSLWRHGPGERIALEVLRDNELRLVHVTGGNRAEFYKQTS